VLRMTPPDPNFICSEIGIDTEPIEQINGSAPQIQKTPAAQR
jgi:hypothetical protein